MSSNNINLCIKPEIRLHLGTLHWRYFNIVTQLEKCTYWLIVEHFDQYYSLRISDYHYLSAMSFGCSPGDIMALSQLAVKVFKAYQDAPSDYRNISDEVKSLHIIISKAAQHLESTTLSSSSRQEGQEVLKGCQNVLVDLGSLIKKYNSLASASTGQVLQRIKLGAEDIATLRARLTSHTTLLSSFIQRSDTFPGLLPSILYYANISPSVVNFINWIECKSGWIVFLAYAGPAQETLLFPLQEVSTLRRPIKGSAKGFLRLVLRRT